MNRDRPVLVVNPRSGSGLGPARWAKLAGPIAAGLGEFDTRFTEGPGDGRRIAREEAAAGRKLVVAVGGDGTISEVADGILASAAAGGDPAARRAPATALGIIPRGTGGDFRRVLDLPADAGAAARRIAESAGSIVDAGHVTYATPDGATERRHFVNVASFGFSSVVAAKANAASKRLGARVAYLGATVRGLLSYDNAKVTIAVDGGAVERRTVLLAAVGNGRFFGGGMKICPEAKIDDGLLDLVVIGDLGRLDVLAKVGRLYDGSHLAMKEVEQVRVRRVEVAPVDPGTRTPVELDGETPGFLPAAFEILPAALQIRF